MKRSDLASVCQIADVCHPNFPESADVLAEKQALSPDTCFVFETKNGVVGYLIAHPYLLDQAPALDCLLGTLPINTDTLYLHDIAIHPDARSSGVASQGIALLVDCVHQKQLSSLSLIAVNGSPLFWQKQGFVAQIPSQVLQLKLKTYSDDAIYMIRNL